MTQAEIAAALQRYAEAKNRRDVEAILDCCTEDSYYETVAQGVKIQGKAALREHYTTLFDGLPDYYGDFDGHAFTDGVSVSWGRFGGTSNGHVSGIPVEKGRKIELPVVFVCEWRDGLLASDRGYFDVLTFLNQAGIDLQQARAGLGTADEDAPDPDSFVDGLRRLWGGRDPEVVQEIVAPDAVLRWPGFPDIKGSDYAEFLRGVFGMFPDVDLKVTATASRDDLVFVSWETAATVGGERVEWSGTDRFRLRGRQAVEALISFNPTPLREAMERAGMAAPPAPARAPAGA